MKHQIKLLFCIVAILVLGCNQKAVDTKDNPEVISLDAKAQSQIDVSGDTITYAMPVNIITVAGMKYVVFITRSGVQVRNLTLDSLEIQSY